MLLFCGIIMHQMPCNRAFIQVKVPCSFSGILRSIPFRYFRSSRRHTFFLFLSFFFGAVVLSFSQAIPVYPLPLDSASHYKEPVKTKPQVVVPTPRSKDTISFIGVGDIMMGTNYPKHRLPPDSGKFLLQQVQSILKDADITFGNLEGVLLDDGGTPKRCSNPDVCYAFRSPVGYAQNLANSGFDVLSLANNHAGDFGDIGRRSTIKALEEMGFYHAGQQTHPYTLFSKDSIRYGFTAFSPNSGCVPLNDVAGAESIIRHLDSLSDIVIVSFHGGAEGASHQHVTRRNEVFYGEDRGNVYALTRKWIDAGADIIFGHGPHVTRAIDVYQKKFIAYSLGNFCTYEGISINGVNGVAPIIKILTTKNGEFIKGKITATRQTRQNGVVIDSDLKVINIIKDLTQKDFPESDIRIDEDGIITYLAH